MTYAQLLNRARLETGKATLTDFDKEVLTYWLNQALADAWTACRHHLWPWAHTVDEVTSDADSRFNLTSLNGSPWATIWTADPRLDNSTAEAVVWARRADKVQLYDSSASATVWVVTATEVPEFDWETPGATDEVPAQFEPYLMAFLAKRRWEDNLPAESEKILSKALNRLENERQTMMELAQSEWESSHWLNWWRTYKN